MAADTETTKLGPNGKPVRPFVMPSTVSGKLNVWRFIIYRRIVQLSTLLLFFGTAHWGWTIAGEPVLLGNLSSSTLLGVIPMADPFAVLQIFLTQHVLQSEVIIGAGIVLLVYTLVGGRVWCAWVCPINMVTDLSAWLRRRLPIVDVFRVNRNTRYTILVLSLIVSAIMGVAAFEWISPISMFHRELIFGLGMGWTAILGIFLFDLFVLRHGWCGHLCPLGAFYGLVGKVAPIRIRFDVPTCTHCGECARVCPEPQVLNLKKATEAEMIASADCTNCGRCITVCPENTLRFGLRKQNKTDVEQPHNLKSQHRRSA
jgi:ferredoxin-type protein NapH